MTDTRIYGMYCPKKNSRPLPSFWPCALSGRICLNPGGAEREDYTCNNERKDYPAKRKDKNYIKNHEYITPGGNSTPKSTVLFEMLDDGFFNFVVVKTRGFQKKPVIFL